MTDSGCEDTVPTVSTMVPSCKLPEESDASMRARLFTSLSQSFPHSQLYKALHGGEDINLNGGDNTDDDDDSLYGDHLSNSCFASLRMDRRDSDDFDDDLRSLEWLQNEDLLKNIGGEKLDKEDDDNEEQKENADIKPDINLLQNSPFQQTPNLPYFPQKHVNSKPPYSFSCLIFMAVEASPQKRLPVKDIYNWILTQFPYFQNAPTGWKNSVRHNLSLNKCFKKVEKDKGQSIGKGSLWCIDPAYRPNLLQALRKTPYHPYHQLQMTSAQPQNYIHYQSLTCGGRTVLLQTQRQVPNTVSPHLFPFLSRRLAQTSFDVDNEMKDVAQTLVALKGSCRKESPDSSAGEDTGPTWRHYKKTSRRPSSPVIVTGHPYDDHAYSSTRVLDDGVPSPSSSSSIDEEYDFGDADEECDSEYPSDMDWDSDDKDEVDGDLSSNKKLKVDLREDCGSTSAPGKGAPAVEESEDDEQKKIHEGANALLNLAGLLLNHHANSSNPDTCTAGKKKDNVKEKGKKERKKKINKKVRDEGKISTIVSPKEEDSGQRIRSVSKRKNAGSNAKYASEEYSLMKPGKGLTKSPSVNTVRVKNVKTKTSKSIADTNLEKDSSPIPKSKLAMGIGENKRTVNKGSARKQKLKLSKTFGTSAKHVSSSSDKTTPATDNKISKTPTHNSIVCKGLPKRRTYKNTQSSLQKKPKAKFENGTSNALSTNDSGLVLPDSSHPSLSSESVNNNSIKVADVAVKQAAANEWQPNSNEVEHVQDERRERAESYVSTKQLSTTVPHVSREIISPAGDAPVKPREISSSSKNDIDFETKLSSPSETPNSSNSDTTQENVAKAVSSKNSPSRSGVSSLTPATIAVHKSPHFTRFSKKKAALS